MTWTLHHGDCLAGLASLGDKSVDHVITDPPYEAEAHTLQRRTKQTFAAGSQVGGEDKRVAAVKAVGFAAITEEQRARVAMEMARVARRRVLVFCQAEAVAAWRDALIAGGATYKRSCIWVKPDGQPQLTGDRPGMGYESIVAAHAPGRSRWNAGGKHGVYVVTIGSDDRSQRFHTTQKPLALMEALVADFTDHGEMILDPFAGSGTTGVAAIRCGRNFIGWERDDKYHAAATKRLAETKEQLVMRPSTGVRAEQLPLIGG